MSRIFPTPALEKYTEKGGSAFWQHGDHVCNTCGTGLHGNSHGHFRGVMPGGMTTKSTPNCPHCGTRLEGKNLPRHITDRRVSGNHGVKSYA